jgi:DNA-binding XRE family transcriptional regulator
MLNRTEVKKRMEELNMTQQTLADAIGVSQPMVTHILIGRKQPSLALAADIARVLGCTVDDLIVHDEQTA